MHQLKNQNTYRFKHTSTQLVSCLLVTLVGMSVTGGRATNAADSPDLLTIAQANPSPSTPTNRTYNNRVKVFFPPVTSSNFTDVRPVWRTTSSRNLAQFAIAQLIAGPTSTEKQQRGLMPAIRLSGNSNCGGDFMLSMDRGLARLKFCRQVVSGGIGDDARATSSIKATLRQFALVKDIIILDRDGNCFGDQSGENMCLKKNK
jgi:hypothetical protein